MLAMLLEMTSTLSCWAAMPVAAVDRALIGRSSRYAAKPVDRPRGQIGGLVDHLGDALVSAADLDQPGDLGDGLDVGAFDHALADARGRGGLGLDVGVIAVEAVAVLRQGRQGREI